MKESLLNWMQSSSSPINDSYSEILAYMIQNNLIGKSFSYFSYS